MISETTLIKGARLIVETCMHVEAGEGATRPSVERRWPRGHTLFARLTPRFLRCQRQRPSLRPVAGEGGPLKLGTTQTAWPLKSRYN